MATGIPGAGRASAPGPRTKETQRLQAFALAGLVLALIVSVAALVRQVRIPRALAMLLPRVLERLAWGRAAHDARDRKRPAERSSRSRF